MNSTKQHDSLIEVAARARVLILESDNGDVIRAMYRVFNEAIGILITLGFSETVVSSKAFKRANELIEESS